MAVFASAVRRSGGRLPVIGVASLAGAGAALALPSMIGATVDALAQGRDPARTTVVAAALVAVIVLSDVVGTLTGTGCVADTTAWLRRRLLAHLLAVDPVRAARLGTGDLSTRVTSNAADAAQAGPALVAAVTSGVPPVGSLVLLFLIDVWLGVAFLAGIALVALVLWVFSRRTSRALNGYVDTQGRIAARLTEALAGARTVAAAGTVAVEERRILEPLPRLAADGMLTWRALSAASAQAAVAAPLVLVAVLATGGYALVAGRISVGALFAAVQYASLGTGLGGLTGVLSRVARARASARRVGEVLALEPVRHGGRDLPPGPGTLELRGARVHDGFAFDLVLPGGTATAVVGRSGAGKSVLAALAARLRDPDEGVVLLDGVPLPELGRTALRRAIGCALERPVLVGATVRDAIDPVGACPAAAEEAARAVDAHAFVSRLPCGYDTPLTEAPLSGGERQRIGLARAWPAQRLLVLDDATSSLDTVTELRVRRALLDVHRRRTRLLVTHRVATAAEADRVVWLEDRRIRAVGPHEELWRDPEYRAVFG